MKLLKNVGLPKDFEDSEGCRQEIEENPNVFYESYVFITDLSFELALSTLESFLSNHYGLLKKTDGEISCVFSSSRAAQDITAQLTNFGEYCGGYINCKTQWSWVSNK